MRSLAGSRFCASRCRPGARIRSAPSSLTQDIRFWGIASTDRPQKPPSRSFPAVWHLRIQRKKEKWTFPVPRRAGSGSFFPPYGKPSADALGLADKGVSTVILKKFWSSFFKSLRGGGRVALLAVRRRRNFPTAFLFCELFSLRLWWLDARLISLKVKRRSFLYLSR